MSASDLSTTSRWEFGRNLSRGELTTGIMVRFLRFCIPNQIDDSVYISVLLRGLVRLHVMKKLNDD